MNEWIDEEKPVNILFPYYFVFFNIVLFTHLFDVYDDVYVDVDGDDKDDE